jgi:hypothetical protein
MMIEDAAAAVAQQLEIEEGAKIIREYGWARFDDGHRAGELAATKRFIVVVFLVVAFGAVLRILT